MAPRRASADPSARRPNSRRRSGSVEQLRYGLGQFVRPGDFDERSGRAKFVRDGLKVFHVRPYDDGFREQRRLEDIVPAAPRQRAAHEDHVGGGEQAAQFADGVEQQDASSSGTPAVRAGKPRTAPDSSPRPPPAFGPRGRTAPACAAPRSGAGRDGGRPAGASFRPRTASSSTSSASAPGMVLAAIHTAAGCRAASQRLTGESGAAARASKSYLKLPATFHPLRRRAQRQKALAHLLALRQDPVRRRQTAREEPRPAADSAGRRGRRCGR